MNKKILTILCTSALAGCFHEIETPEAVIDVPPLLLEKEFDELRFGATEVTLSEGLAKSAISDVIYRFMNTVEIANQTADLLAKSDEAPPVKYKTSARSVYVVDASREYCSTNDLEAGGAQAAIWDDRDNSSNASKGDIWYYRIENCQSSLNSSYYTGLITQTGMGDILLLDDAVDEPFSDYLYTLNMQIDALNGNSVYYRNAQLNYSRTDDDNTAVTIQNGATMAGQKDGDVELFLFDFSGSSVNHDEFNELVEVNFSARYYDSELGGYITVSTPDPLVFEYTLKVLGESRQENNPFETITLLSGKLQISSKSDSATLTVDGENENNVEFLFNGNTSTSEKTLQSNYFNVAADSNTFSLVNLSN